MLNANLFFLTEVKGLNVQLSEKIGNFFLRPAQYLWKGKKIDFIQFERNFAVQKDEIYKPCQRSWFKSLFMIIALIPGTILGTGFKLYATLRYHIPAHDTLIMNCLQPRHPNLNIISNNADFASEVTSYIEALNKEFRSHPDLHIDNYIYKNHKGERICPFLSEIEGITLVPEYETTCSVTNSEGMNNNDAILEKIYFLWNLSVLNVGNRYCGSVRSPLEDTPLVKAAVINKNPSIRYRPRPKYDDGRDHYYERSVEDFFTESEPLL